MKAVSEVAVVVFAAADEAIVLGVAFGLAVPAVLALVALVFVPFRPSTVPASF